jgi:putative flippase GtrA
LEVPRLPPSNLKVREAAIPHLRSLLVEFGRMVRFGVVGACATLVYVAVAGPANEAFGILPVVASLLGVTASLGVSYFGHLFFSFRVEPNHGEFLWRFVLIAALSFGLSGGATWLVANVMELSPRFAIATVIVVIPIVNYVCNRCWVFKPGITAQIGAQPEPSHQATKFDGGLS